VDDKAASRERQKKKRSSKDREVEAAEKIARRLGPPPRERETYHAILSKPPTSQ
jgi:hypothetical protein